MGEFGQDAEVTPLLFSKDILRFLITTESQDLGLHLIRKTVLFDSIVSRHYTGALGPTQNTEHLFQQQPSFLRSPIQVLPRLNPAGQPVLGCRMIWLPTISPCILRKKDKNIPKKCDKTYLQRNMLFFLNSVVICSSARTFLICYFLQEQLILVFHFSPLLLVFGAGPCCQYLGFTQACLPH